MTAMANANKRKRDRLDQGAGGHPPPHPSDNYSQYINHPADGDAALAEVLTKHNAGGAIAAHRPNAPPVGGPDPSASDTASAALHYSMGAPPAPEAAYMVAEDSTDHSENAAEPNFDIGSPNPPATSTSGVQSSEYTVERIKETAKPRNSAPPKSPIPTPATVAPAPPKQQTAEQSSSPSPAEDPSLSPSSHAASNRHKVGSEEWAASRRLAHKEVERRRREAINDGISELGKIVPGAERNKGSILHRAVIYINELKERQTSTETKNNLEKMVFEQAIAEVTTSAEKLKTDVRRLEAEVERWRSTARAAGVGIGDEGRR